MPKIKRLVLGFIPNQKCNLKCKYCYISQVKGWEEPSPLKYPPEYIAKCLSVKRLGGISLINLTGNGETLLQPDIVELVEAILREGHFVEIVTNGTISTKINEILKFPKEMLSRIHFKVSFHYSELCRLGILEKFFENIINIHETGAAFTLELMANDDIENDIDTIKEICIKKLGVVCHATIGRTENRMDKALLSKHSKDEFRKIWSPLNSPMLNFKLDVIGIKRREFCYAGDWSIFVNLYTGESQPCYWQPYNQNLFKNPDKPINFNPVGYTCTQPYCVNAHAHMAWGIIPEVDTPTYCEMRNRIAKDGTQWLTPECREFFSSKLKESNDEYSFLHKLIYTLFYPFLLLKWFFRDFNNNIKRLRKITKRF